MGSKSLIEMPQDTTYFVGATCPSRPLVGGQLPCLGILLLTTPNVLLQICGSEVRGVRLRQLEENAGSCRQLQGSSLFQKGQLPTHKVAVLSNKDMAPPHMVVAPFIHRLNNSGTLPDGGSPYLRTRHMVT